MHVIDATKTFLTSQLLNSQKKISEAILLDSKNSRTFIYKTSVI